MRRAAIYTRISRDVEEQGLGVARQERLCRDICRDRGWAVDRVYVDNDVSASANRPAFERLLGDLAGASFDTLVALDLDRLTRSHRDLLRIVDACVEHKVRVAFQHGGFDPVTGDGMLEVEVRTSVAAEEIRKLRQRVTRKAEELAAAGKVGGGGTRPFGYRRDRTTVKQSEAELIREAVGRVLAGESLRGILTDWTKRGVKTVTGRPWRTPTLRRLLMSARIAGLREHRGEIVAEAEWPAIISREEHERVRRVLTDPARFTNGAGLARSYLLTGLLVCGRCGVDANVKLVARPKADKRRQYVCAAGPDFDGCGALTTLAEPVEELIAEAVMQRVDARRLASAVREREGDGDDVAAELAGIEARQATLADDWADGKIGRAEWLRARDRLEARGERARRRLETDTRTAALAPYGHPGALRAAWPGLPFSKRRAIVAAVIDRVVVNPAVRGRTRFDPDRIDVLWRL